MYTLPQSANQSFNQRVKQNNGSISKQVLFYIFNFLENSELNTTIFRVCKDWKEQSQHPLLCNRERICYFSKTVFTGMEDSILGYGVQLKFTKTQRLVHLSNTC